MTLNNYEAELYARIQSEGNWLVDPKCLNYAQQQALLRMRRAGLIEQASYGGYRVKGQGAKPAPTAATVTALLVSAGLPSTRIRKVMPTTDAWARPGAGQQFTVALDKAGGLAGVDKGAFAEWICDGAIVIVRVKG